MAEHIMLSVVIALMPQGEVEGPSHYQFVEVHMRAV